MASDDRITINQTDPVSFSCQAYGIPSPLLRWVSSKNLLQTIQEEPGVLTISFSSNLTVTISTLEIMEAYRSVHEANYSCIAENGVTNFISTPEFASIELIVQGTAKKKFELKMTVAQIV